MTECEFYRLCSFFEEYKCSSQSFRDACREKERHYTRPEPTRVLPDAFVQPRVLDSPLEEPLGIGSKI